MFLRTLRLRSLAAPAAASVLGGLWLQKSVFAEEANKVPDLSSKKFTPLKVTKIEQITGDTKLITMGGNASFPACSFAVFKAPFQKDGKGVFRPYTPISSEDGQISFAVKVYPDGVMSKHCGELKVGDTVDVKGPINKMEYKPNMKKHVGLVAGGTGITPMLQILLQTLNDDTKLHLLFANRSVDDILFLKPLEILSGAFPDKVRIHYMVDKGTLPDLTGSANTAGVGYVSKEVLKQTMPPPTLGDDVLIMVCGPPGFYKAVSGSKAKDYSQGELDGYLKELGYSKNQVFKA